ncbi:alkaline phosphatase [Acinetobacter sp. ANC 4470]|uniref:choice-of-anchor I family protein n=1 Tax=Acinetobacter sp. ANC 4470 TaxID=1977881 RepID=UPI000A339394|nr:choice-of-anchor I family protein [Acinetobacter sp. ANC 4470]OTG68854.1 alkaline phosphatase [Acinetobacter sp. ANC 4470]
MKIQFSALMIALLSVGMVACNDDQKNEVIVTPAVVEEKTPNSIELVRIGGYETGIFGASAAEIPAFDAASKRLFVVNAKKGMVDVLDMTQPEKPVHIGELSARTYLAESDVNSVAVHQGIVALAVQAKNKTDNGIVAFFNAKDLSFISQVEVGALPDMLVFTPDSKKVLVANEGEPSAGYAVDPQGSISIIDVSNIQRPLVKTAGFSAWNSQKQSLLEAGVRIFGPDARQYANITTQGIPTTTVAQDLEPEYITISTDGKTAWATLQENNAIAKIDLMKDEVVDIFPIGYKDHGLAENAFDASDKNLGINIQAWSGVFGMYMPDTIAQYQVNGQTYLVTANEGDAREWLVDADQYFKGDDLNAGYAEEIRVKHLFNSKGFRNNGDYAAHLRQIAPNVKGAKLDPSVFCHAVSDVNSCLNSLMSDSQLGRLTMSWTQGYKKDALTGLPLLDEKGLMTYDKLYAYGGRSFSIIDPFSKKIVWDSGKEFEAKVAEMMPQYFNSNHEEAKFDDRSDNKGPEPEGVALGKIGNKTFAFIGLERQSGIMVYDISQPKKGQFVQYFNDRKMTELPNKQGDLGPEGLIFIAAKDSPNGQPLLVVGNEVSGSTAIYQVKLS